MRIAVLIKNTHLHKFYGGMETQNKVLVEGLAMLGHEIRVYSPAKDVKENTITENSVTYVFVPCIFKKFSVLHSKNRTDWRRRSYEYIRADHAISPFDIIICQSSSGIGLFPYKKDLDIKIISISHGSKIGEFLSRLKSLSSFKDFVKLLIDVPHVLYAFFVTQRIFIHGSDKVIAVSNAVKKAIVDETFVPESKVVVIHNGIKTAITADKLHPKNSKEVPELIYVGRVIRAKGLFLLLDALSNLKMSPWKLSIVGDGEDFDAFSKRVSILQLANRVHLLGKIPHDAAMSAMLDADVFLLPSIRIEGLPMVLIEAMFAGLPVIATDVGGNSDAVADGQTGYLIKPGSVEALQEKLHSLLSDPGMRVRMGENARLIAEQKFTASVMVNGYLQVIKELLDENS